MKPLDRRIALPLMLALLLACAGCRRPADVEAARTARPSPEARPSQPAAPAPGTLPSLSRLKPRSGNGPLDGWLGPWIGPEGTSLLLTRNGDKYVIEIQSLDGPATYEGVAAGNNIRFERNGKTETIHAGSGRETGMKWLLDEKNCLIIREGEGFCRAPS